MTATRPCDTSPACLVVSRTVEQAKTNFRSLTCRDARLPCADDPCGQELPGSSRALQLRQGDQQDSGPSRPGRVDLQPRQAWQIARTRQCEVRHHPFHTQRPPDAAEPTSRRPETVLDIDRRRHPADPDHHITRMPRIVNLRREQCMCLWQLGKRATKANSDKRPSYAAAGQSDG